MSISSIWLLLHNVNLNINVLISTPDERPLHLKGHFSDAKGVASQERFHCTCICCTEILKQPRNVTTNTLS